MKHPFPIQFPFVVQVEQAHIDQGEPFSAVQNPIALELLKQLPNGMTVWVGDDNIIISDTANRRAWMIDLPNTAQNWIIAYDRQPKAAKPLEFIVDSFHVAAY